MSKDKELISFTYSPKIYVHQGVTNMSCSFNGLNFLVVKHLKREPRGNEIFVFFNKARTKIKIYFYNINGYCIIYKTLDNQVFDVEIKNGYRVIRGVNPIKLLEGIKMETE